MKISQNISFSKQLIIYLILVLFVVFFLISLALVNSLEQFINNNAYSQAKAIANNALIIFEREIARIESIPQNVTDMQGELNYKNIPDLPIRILRSYKTLIGSSVHYDLKNPEVADFIHINAYRTADEKIHFTQPDPCIIRKTKCSPLFKRSDISYKTKRPPKNNFPKYSRGSKKSTGKFCFSQCFFL